MLSDQADANAELRRSFGWRTVAAAGGMASALLLSIIIVRFLDPHEAATFFAILAALAIGPLVGRLGLGPNVIRLVPAEPDLQVRRRIAGAHLHATILLSCLSAPVVAFIGCSGILGKSNFYPVFVITAVLIAVDSTRLMLSDIFAATGRVTASVATMHYIRNLLALPCVALVLFWVKEPSLVVVLGAYLAASVLQFAVALAPARHDVAFWHFTGGVSTLRTSISQGTQLFALEFSVFMMMQGTIWLSTAAFSPVAATQYGIAVTLAFQVTVLEGLSSLAVTPPAARLWAAGKKEQVVRMLSNAATLSTAVVIVVVGLLAILGGFVIDFAYGSDMRPAATMLLILAVSGIVQACFAVNMTMLIVSGHIAATSRSALLVLSVALPCAVAAAWLSGPTGLAVVTSLSVSAMSICQWLTARKYCGHAPRAHHHVIRAARELRQTSDASADVETVP